MSRLVEVPLYRPNRNFVRVGDPVRVEPRVGKPFEARVLRILADRESGEVREVEVVGSRGDHPLAIRTVVPSCVHRRAVTKGGERVSRIRESPEP